MTVQQVSAEGGLAFEITKLAEIPCHTVSPAPLPSRACACPMLSQVPASVCAKHLHMAQLHMPRAKAEQRALQAPLVFLARAPRAACTRPHYALTGLHLGQCIRMALQATRFNHCNMRAELQPLSMRQAQALIKEHGQGACVHAQQAGFIVAEPHSWRTSREDT